MTPSTIITYDMNPKAQITTVISTSMIINHHALTLHARNFIQVNEGN